MKMEEFNRVLKYGEEYVVFVKDYKIIQINGLARIVFSQKLYSWIDIFIREVRFKVFGLIVVFKESVFLTWNGETMEFSQINKVIKFIWKKVGMEGSFSVIFFRKLVVLEVYIKSESNEVRGNLVDLMVYNVEIARKYYYL